MSREQIGTTCVLLGREGGDRWMASLQSFKNIRESPCGFGPTREVALAELAAAFVGICDSVGRRAEMAGSVLEVIKKEVDV